MSRTGVASHSASAPCRTPHCSGLKAQRLPESPVKQMLVMIVISDGLLSVLSQLQCPYSSQAITPGFEFARLLALQLGMLDVLWKAAKTRRQGSVMQHGDTARRLAFLRGSDYLGMHAGTQSLKLTLNKGKVMREESINPSCT